MATDITTRNLIWEARREAIEASLGLGRRSLTTKADRAIAFCTYILVSDDSIHPGTPFAGQVSRDIQGLVSELRPNERSKLVPANAPWKHLEQCAVILLEAQKHLLGVSEGSAPLEKTRYSVYDFPPPDGAYWYNDRIAHRWEIVVYQHKRFWLTGQAQPVGPTYFKPGSHLFALTPPLPDPNPTELVDL